MLSLTSAAVVTGISLIIPLLIRFARLPVPDAVGQIIAGIIVGPQLLTWAGPDAPVQVLALVGLGFLLLLAGLEIDGRSWAKSVVIRALFGFAVSFALALLVGFGLSSFGIVKSPLLIAVTLSATSLGIILPILKDAGQVGTGLGRMIIAGASVAEIAPIVLLSVLFSARGGGVVAPVVLLVSFLALVAAVAIGLATAEKNRPLRRTLLVLQETTAEVRVRGAVALLMLFAALAAGFGVEAILGAFLAGATINVLDRDQTRTHPLFRVKLRAIGFGVFVPFFFVSTGMSLDVRALVDDPATLVRVPVFLAALLIVRAVPALIPGRSGYGRSQLFAVGLFPKRRHSTSPLSRARSLSPCTSCPRPTTRPWWPPGFSRYLSSRRWRCVC